MPFLLTDSINKAQTDHKDNACVPKDTSNKNIRDGKETKAKMIYDPVLASLSPHI